MPTPEVSWPWQPKPVPARIGGDGSVHHGGSESERAPGAAVNGSALCRCRRTTDSGVQITPQGPDLLGGKVAAFVRDHRCRAGSRLAVACSGECGLKEGLGGHGSRALRATPTCHSSKAAAVLQDYVGVGLIKALAAHRHHVRNGVNVDRLIFVGNSPADIAELEGDLAR